MLTRALCWWRGWRIDHDGWIVRARRKGDPMNLPSSIGFIEESAIAVRTFAQARALDRAEHNAFPQVRA
jgi:hypothetical protein